MSELPKYLYHGTSADGLAAVLEQSLVPRNEGVKSRWTHTVESRPDAVYLTTAYPLHFAANASAGGDMLIVEVETSRLNHDLLFADEDCLALSVRDPETAAMDAKERAEYYRQHSHKYPASFSLKRMGTCAYLGRVPREALSRALLIPAEYRERLILGGFDPVIAPMNYKFFGVEYEASVSWLFGDVEVCAINPAMPRMPFDVRSLR